MIDLFKFEFDINDKDDLTYYTGHEEVLKDVEIMNNISHKIPKLDLKKLMLSGIINLYKNFPFSHKIDLSQDNKLTILLG